MGPDSSLNATAHEMKGDARGRERQLESIIASAMDAIISIDEEQRIVLFNAAAETMFRCPAADALGQRIERFIPERFRRGHDEHVRRFGQTRVTKRSMGSLGAIFGLRTNGEEFPIEASISQSEVGGRKLYTVILRDISERKQAEDRFRLAVESAPNAMLMVDAQGTILLVNSQTERLFGYTRDEVIGQSVDMLVPPRFRRNHPQYRAAFADRPQVRPMGAGRDLYGLRKDQSEVPVEIGLNPIDTPEGVLILSSIVDITERKRAEAERDELLAREQAARADAETANRMKDEFLATVSHELRTPLNAILGWAQMLQQADLDAERAKHGLETIQRNARAQTQLINDLLDVSRIITGQLKMEMNPVELIPVVKAAMDAISPTAEVKGIHLQASFDYGTGLVSGDAHRLQQIVWNLLSNAIKFTPPGGRVELRLERTDAHVEITVADSGKGISPTFLPHVFDRFSQADGSITRRYGGLGLGLSIVRHIVELHAGSVRAYSAGEGRGATFTVSLPLMPAREKQRPLPIPEMRTALPSLDGLRVLVVDDEQDTRDLLVTILEQSKAVAQAALSASEALEMIDVFKPAILVSDIGMPGGDGYALIRSVRTSERGQAKRMPAVALTAHARAEDRIRALSEGFQAHVSKPVEPEELIAVIASVVGQ